MEIFSFFLFGALCGGFFTAIFFHHKNTLIKKEDEHRIQNINELTGKYQQMTLSFASLENKYDLLLEKNREISSKLTKYESEEEYRKKETLQKIQEIENARKSFEDEKARIREQEEKRREEEEEKRNRIWNEHENKAGSLLKELCSRPHIQFSFYEHTNLPEGFEGKFKPDFLVEFLGQYIVFDAKMTKPDSTNTLEKYLQAQSKATAKKINESNQKEMIYKMVFFVIPNRNEELKNSSWFEGGIEFYAVHLSSLESLLSTLKRVKMYDNIQLLDPQERETLVQVLASYDMQISYQNSIHILSALMGIQTTQELKNLSPEMQEKISLREKNMRIENFKPTDIKKFLHNPNEQIKYITQMIQKKDPDIDLENSSLS
jgi:hypothetical protein